MHDYLTEAKMLDYSNENIKQLIRERKWSDMAEFERLKAIYTFVQSEGINQDFGVYDSPDELLKEHHQEMSRVKAFLYRNWGRHMMNRNVRKIRGK